MINDSEFIAFVTNPQISSADFLLCDTPVRLVKMPSLNAECIVLYSQFFRDNEYYFFGKYESFGMYSLNEGMLYVYDDDKYTKDFIIKNAKSRWGAKGFYKDLHPRFAEALIKEFNHELWTTQSSLSDEYAYRSFYQVVDENMPDSLKEEKAKIIALLLSDEPQRSICEYIDERLNCEFAEERSQYYHYNKVRTNQLDLLMMKFAANPKGSFLAEEVENIKKEKPSLWESCLFLVNMIWKVNYDREEVLDLLEFPGAREYEIVCSIQDKSGKVRDCRMDMRFPYNSSYGDAIPLFCFAKNTTRTKLRKNLPIQKEFVRSDGKKRTDAFVRIQTVKQISDRQTDEVLFLRKDNMDK